MTKWIDAIWNAIFFITGLVAGAVLLAFLLSHNSIEFDLPNSKAIAYCIILPK